LQVVEIRESFVDTLGTRHNFRDGSLDIQTLIQQLPFLLKDGVRFDQSPGYLFQTGLLGSGESLLEFAGAAPRIFQCRVESIATSRFRYTIFIFLAQFFLTLT